MSKYVYYFDENSGDMLFKHISSGTVYINQSDLALKLSVDTKTIRYRSKKRIVKGLKTVVKLPSGINTCVLYTLEQAKQLS